MKKTVHCHCNNPLVNGKSWPKNTMKVHINEGKFSLCRFSVKDGGLNVHISLGTLLKS